MFDVETDLQYNRARWYDPATGRWQTQDPMGFAAGDSNLYRYATNDPLVSEDPSGLQEVVPAINWKTAKKITDPQQLKKLPNPNDLYKDAKDAKGKSPNVPGEWWSVDTRNGRTILVWKGTGKAKYFCHGLTFGGNKAENGPFSPTGAEVPEIMSKNYARIPGAANAKNTLPGSVLIIVDGKDRVLHSAVFDKVVFTNGSLDENKTTLATKNGIEKQGPPMTLAEINKTYGVGPNMNRATIWNLKEKGK